MTRRFPLWAAFLPVALGLAAYWWYWRSEAETFRSEVAAVVPGTPVEVAGFPYRVEARLARIEIAADRSGGIALLSAGRVVVNRQPWRTGHVVIAAENPRIAVALPGLLGVRMRVEGPAVLASLRRPDDIVERLSMRFETAWLWLPTGGEPYEASALEIHLRETPATPTASASPTFPVQAEARLVGTLARPGGAKFGIELPFYATAARRIASVGDWRRGGTLEIKGGRLLGADGTPVAGFDATLAPLPDGSVAVAGTVDTECPVTVRALIEGKSPGAEFRTRRAQRMSITGTLAGGIELGAPQGASGGPVRSQEPPCPVLRR